MSLRPPIKEEGEEGGGEGEEEEEEEEEDLQQYVTIFPSLQTINPCLEHSVLPLACNARKDAAVSPVASCWRVGAM